MLGATWPVDGLLQGVVGDTAVTAPSWGDLGQRLHYKEYLCPNHDVQWGRMVVPLVHTMRGPVRARGWQVA